MKLAVCLLLIRDGKVLAVSRTKKSGVEGDWGLPGGKVNPGEPIEDAICRETLEETSLAVRNVKLIFSEVDDGREFLVHTFVGEGEGTPVDSDEGHVAWVSPAELVDDKCTFREYNRRLFAKAGVSYSGGENGRASTGERASGENSV